jgi:hypothetical protein
MSSKEEWQEYQDALRRGDQEAAAKAFKRYLEAKKQEGGMSSKPNLVSLGIGKDYPTAIPVDDIAAEIERNPAFFEHIKKITAEE